MKKSKGTAFLFFFVIVSLYWNTSIHGYINEKSLLIERINEVSLQPVIRNSPPNSKASKSQNSKNDDWFDLDRWNSKDSIAQEYCFYLENVCHHAQVWFYASDSTTTRSSSSGNRTTVSITLNNKANATRDRRKRRKKIAEMSFPRSFTIRPIIASNSSTNHHVCHQSPITNHMILNAFFLNMMMVRSLNFISNTSSVKRVPGHMNAEDYPELTVEDHRYDLKRVKESKSSSPSGLHYGLWKANGQALVGPSMSISG